MAAKTDDNPFIAILQKEKTSDPAVQEKNPFVDILKKEREENPFIAILQKDQPQPEEPDKPSKLTDIPRGFVTTAKTLPLETVGGLLQKTGEAAQQPFRLQDAFGPFGVFKSLKKLTDVAVRKVGLGQATKEQGQRISAKAQEIKARPESQPAEDSFSSKFLFGVGGGIATLGASLTAAVVSGGNPAVPAAIFALIKKGQVFGELTRTQPDLPFEKRDEVSTSQAIAEGGLEFVSVGSLLKIFGGKAKTAAVKGLKGALGRAGKAALAEGGTELTQEVADIAIPKIEGISDETFAENGERLALSFLIGATLGGGASGVFDVARQIGVKKEEISDEVLTDAIQQTGKEVTENVTEDDEAALQAAQEKISEVPISEIRQLAEEAAQEIPPVDLDVGVTEEGAIPPPPEGFVPTPQQAATEEELQGILENIRRLEGVELEEAINEASPVDAQVPALSTIDQEQQQQQEGISPLETVGGRPSGVEKEQSFAARVIPALNPEIQENIPEGSFKYESISDVEAQKFAQNIIDKDNNIDLSIEKVINTTNDLPGNTRVAMGIMLLDIRDRQYDQAKAQGDAAALAKISDDVIRLEEKLSQFLNLRGREVSTARLWNKMRPEQFVRKYRKDIARAQQKFIRENPDKINQAPSFDPKVAKEIFQKAKEMKQAPKGFQRDIATMDVLNTIATAEGAGIIEVGTALWYASILASIGTNTVNIMGAIGQTMAEFTIESIIAPSKVPVLTASLYQALGKGKADFWHTLKTGRAPLPLIKVREAGILERVSFKGSIFNPLNAFKFSFRFMLAGDMFTSTTAREMKSSVLARNIALKEGLNGADLSRKISEILHNTKEIRIAAEQQADAEELKGNTRIKRVFEIMEQERPPALAEEAFNFSRKMTYNQDPVGVMGWFAEKVNEFHRKFPIGGVFVRVYLPFVRIAANMFNASVDWTPAGYVKTFRAYGWTPAARRAKFKELPNIQEEYYKDLTKATLASVGMAGLLSLSLASLDDDEPLFRINGPGPKSFQKRRFLRDNTNWKPNTVQFGNTLINFADSPFFLGLGVMGAVSDAARFGELDDKSIGDRTTIILQASGKVITSPTFLNGMSEMIDVISGERKVLQSLKRKFVSIPGAIVSPRILKEIQSIFDPTVVDDTTVKATLFKNTPAARLLGGTGAKTLINVFGEPIEIGFGRKVFGRFVRFVDKDSLAFKLTSKGAFVTFPSKTTTFGDRTMSPDEHYQYVLRSGQTIKKDLEKLVRNPRFLAFPDEAFQRFVSNIVKSRRNEAKNILILNALRKGTLKLESLKK